jgi:hypothetical protein
MTVFHERITVTLGMHTKTGFGFLLKYNVRRRYGTVVENDGQRALVWFMR